MKYRKLFNSFGMKLTVSALSAVLLVTPMAVMADPADAASAAASEASQTNTPEEDSPVTSAAVSTTAVPAPDPSGASDKKEEPKDEKDKTTDTDKEKKSTEETKSESEEKETTTKDVTTPDSRSAEDNDKESKDESDKESGKKSEEPKSEENKSETDEKDNSGSGSETDAGENTGENTSDDNVTTPTTTPDSGVTTPNWRGSEDETEDNTSDNAETNTTTPTTTPKSDTTTPNWRSSDETATNSSDAPLAELPFAETPDFSYAGFIPQVDLAALRKPVTITDFRFWTVGKTPAAAVKDCFVKEDMSDTAKNVGKLDKNDIVYLLKEDGDWAYTESGSVRGFVKISDLATGDDAKKVLDQHYTEMKVKDEEKANADLTPYFAEALVPQAENNAFAYYRATTRDVVVDKIYAVAADDIRILTAKEESASEAGTLSFGGLAYVLEDKKDGWLFVESGDVRGFVKAAQMDTSKELQDAFGNGTKRANDYPQAKESVAAEDNPALYYTLTSIKSGRPDGSIRESIVEYAASFIGNPYVWGGTDPENGADCSGFVQSIYAQYGVSIPRTTQQQCKVGTKIDVEDAKPGDLIFYMDETGDVYHVAMYAGNGETVEAYNPSVGIIHGTVAENACWAVRLLDDEVCTVDIPETYQGYPVGTNNCYTVTHNYGTRKWAYNCAYVAKKWVEAGSVYTENCATIDGAFLIACTSYFGSVGDRITWTFDDGSTMDTIMADTKSSHDPNYTPYGHISGNVINVLEFETDALINPGNIGCLPEINGKRVVSAVNHGYAF